MATTSMLLRRTARSRYVGGQCKKKHVSNVRHLCCRTRQLNGRQCVVFMLPHEDENVAFGDPLLSYRPRLVVLRSNHRQSIIEGYLPFRRPLIVEVGSLGPCTISNNRFQRRQGVTVMLPHEDLNRRR